MVHGHGNKSLILRYQIDHGSVSNGQLHGTEYSTAWGKYPTPYSRTNRSKAIYQIVLSPVLCVHGLVAN